MDSLIRIVNRHGHGKYKCISTLVVADVKCSTPNSNTPTVDWSHIQGLFERARSDVLVLMDCCAAASSAPRRGDALMETIAACGFEGRAPPPGEHSFTTSLIEVLKDWQNVPSISITMLHSEVLRVLMRRRTERCRNGQKLEWRSTPVYINNYTHSRTIGIELCKRNLLNTESFSSPRPSQSIQDLLQPTAHLTSETYLDLMSLSCDGLGERPRGSGDTRELRMEPSSSVSTDKALNLPHMLISISLDEGQTLPNAEACSRWLCSFPGLARHVKVEGVYTSYSTVLILSIPVVIWNMLPDNPACLPIANVTSRNLVTGWCEQDLDFKRSLTKNLTPPSTSTDGPRFAPTSFSDGSNGDKSLVDLQDCSLSLDPTLGITPEAFFCERQQSYGTDFEPAIGNHHGANTALDSASSSTASTTPTLCTNFSPFLSNASMQLSDIENALRNRYTPTREILQPLNQDTSSPDSQLSTMPETSSAWIRTPNTSRTEQRLVSNIVPIHSSDEGSAFPLTVFSSKYCCPQTTLPTCEYHPIARISIASTIKGLRFPNFYHLIIAKPLVAFTRTLVSLFWVQHMKVMGQTDNEKARFQGPQAEFDDPQSKHFPQLLG